MYKESFYKRPAVEVSEGGRIFAARIVNEEKKAVLVTSDDGGEHWSTASVIAEAEGNEEISEQILWIDPKGRLWHICSFMPFPRTECRVCDAPDDKELLWRQKPIPDFGTMLSKPVVSVSGKWLFPSAVTRPERAARSGDAVAGGLIFRSDDEGETLVLHTEKPIASGVWFDSISLIDKKAGTVVYLRAPYGIGKCVSKNGGVTFGSESDSNFSSYGTRFAIVKLENGHILLVSKNHFGKGGALCLSAMLATTNGVTFQGVLNIDDDADVSTPDVIERGGYIYIAYDRGGEVVINKLTERDILCYEVTNSGTRLGIKVDF